MKSRILLFLIILCPFTSQAQLNVNQYGNVGIGIDVPYWLDPSGDNTEIMDGLLYVSKTFAITDDECIYGNIRITGTGQLTIQGDIEMGGDGTLTVESGGKLFMDGDKLTNAKLDLKPGSTLRILNGGVIETRNGFKAPVGVKVDISYGRII